MYNYIQFSSVEYKSTTIYIYIYLSIYILYRLYIHDRSYNRLELVSTTVGDADNSRYNGYTYISAPQYILYIYICMCMYISAVLETALICKMKASVMHDRVVLGLNSRYMTVSQCPSPLGHAKPHGGLKKGNPLQN